MHTYDLGEHSPKREEYISRIKFGGRHSDMGTDRPQHALVNSQLIQSLHSCEILSSPSLEGYSANLPMPIPVPVVGRSKSILNPCSQHRHPVRAVTKQQLHALRDWSSSVVGIDTLELVATMTATSAPVRDDPPRTSRAQSDQLPSMLMSQALRCCHSVCVRAQATPLELWRPPILPLPIPSAALRVISCGSHQLAVRKPRFPRIHLADDNLTNYACKLIRDGITCHASTNSSPDADKRVCGSMCQVQLTVAGDFVALHCTAGGKGAMLTFHASEA